MYIKNKLLRKVYWLRSNLLIVFIAFCSLLSAQNPNQKISLSIRNSSIKELIKKIEAKSNYTVIYRDVLVDDKKDISIDATDKSLKEILETALNAKGLTVDFSGKTIVITQVKIIQSNKKEKITGAVTDLKGEPIIGASVLIKGSTSGTITNVDGKFSIDAASKSILIVSYIGYLSTEIPVGQKSNIAVVLKEDAKNLEEVVVVGYGVQKKVNVTGSVASVNGKTISKSPVSNITNALVGNLPGLRATLRTGEPGWDNSSIDIRGFGNALIIVDGVPSSFSQLDPAEIESVSILKDGSAAIYGVRSANGVVLVTTKKGTDSKPKITFNTYSGVQSATRYPKFCTAAEHVELMEENSINTGAGSKYKDLLQKYRDGVPGYENTDWYNLVVRNNTPQKYYNMTASGGTAASKYFVSLGYFDQMGMWKTGTNNFSRYNFRGNISSIIAKRITMELNLSGRLEARNSPGNNAGTIMNQLQRTYPTIKPYANDNPLYLQQTNIGPNLLASIDQEKTGFYLQKDRSFNGILTINYEVPYIKGLNAKAMYSYLYANQNITDWKKRCELYSYSASTNTYVSSYSTLNNSNIKRENTNSDKKLFQLSLNYDTKINEMHCIKGLLLFERAEGASDRFNAYRDFQLDILPEIFAGIDKGKTNDGSASENANMGYVGRLNYDYDNKYLLEAGFRYDGSYLFPNKSRFGFFPTFSAGWRMSNEAFLKENNVISNLKLRASWGRMGDDGGATPFSWIGGYKFPQGAYVFGDDITQGLLSTGVPNDQLTWYTSTTTNFGFETGFFKNKLTVDLDLFYRERIGLLTQRILTLPDTYAADIPQENLNSDNTRGFELVVGYADRINDFQYKVSANTTWTRSRNDYIEQAAPTNSYINWKDNGSNRWNNRYWGYKSSGQFQSMEETKNWAIQDGKDNSTLLPGDIKYEDLNGDGVINEMDQTYIGRGDKPELFYGCTLSGSYKSFDFSVLLQGAALFNAYFNGSLQVPLSNNSNSYEMMTDRWHKVDMYDPNSEWISGKYPSTRADGIASNKRTSDFWLKDASYLRVKTIEVGYTIQKALVSKLGLDQVRFYFSGQNLFTFDKVKFIDPEAPGGWGNYYPQQRVLTFGVNVQL
jgi:TonB-linked SusC/RagA family outer membrane protein